MHSFTTKTMQPETEWWKSFFKWADDNKIFFVIFGLMWKTIDKVFKYFSDSRDEELKKIVQDEIKPIKEAVDDLKETFIRYKIHSK